MLWTGLGYLVLLAIALSAAGRISKEREQRTLDSLFILPVERWEIIYSKWLGCLTAPALCVVMLPLAVAWLVEIVFRPRNVYSIIVSTFGLVLVAATWMITAGLVASLGLWLSAVCQTTVRARLLTFLMVLLFLVAPLDWLLPFPITTDPQDWVEWIGLIVKHVLSPGTVLGTLFFALAGFSNPWRRTGFTPEVLAAVVALPVYLGLTKSFLYAALRQLRGERTCATESTQGKDEG